MYLPYCRMFTGKDWKTNGEERRCTMCLPSQVLTRSEAETAGRSLLYTLRNIDSLAGLSSLLAGWLGVVRAPALFPLSLSLSVGRFVCSDVGCAFKSFGDPVDPTPHLPVLNSTVLHFLRACCLTSFSITNRSVYRVTQV